MIIEYVTCLGDEGNIHYSRNSMYETFNVFMSPFYIMSYVVYQIGNVLNLTVEYKFDSVNSM